MAILKEIYRTLTKVAKQAWLLPQSLSMAVKERPLQVEGNEVEAEWLDRIRNPSKHLGK